MLRGWTHLVIALPKVPSPTLYNAPFSHNTSLQTDRQTTDVSYPRLDLTVGHKCLSGLLSAADSSSAIFNRPY